jgi:cyclase
MNIQSISSAAFGGALLVSSALFTNIALAQEPVWDANKVNLQSEQLADGVFVYFDENAKELEKKGVPLATSGGFIVGDNAVLMIDTMLNERLYKQAKKLIEKQTEKPLVYAVNTSFHGDHSYGNMYLPKETKIIQHSVTAKYIDEHFVEDTEFMMYNFGKGRGIEEIKPVDADILVGTASKITIDLGNKLVDIIDFGFAQTGGDLFVWESESKTLYAGNPIIALKPSLPWLLDGHLVETLESLTKVYDFLPSDARIVPGHGFAISKEDLRWHIDYLQAVKSEVQKAVNEGLTLEQTVKRVQLPEFQGYALHGWVHPSLNIPAAYKDLNK